MITFKGVTSDAKYVTVLEYPVPTKPALRVETVEIPGRHGFVTLAGEATYEAYLLECQCMIDDASKAAGAAAWLTGSGDLILGSDPNYVYDAKINDEYGFHKILRGHGHKRFTVPFLCQPLKRAVSPEADIELTASGSVTNIGHVASKPLLLIEGSGDVTLMIGSQILEIAGIDTSILIDVDMGMAFDALYTENLSAQVSGDWPVLAVGSNAVSWTGTVSKVTITPRWRYL